MKEYYEEEAKIKVLYHDSYYLNSVKSMLKRIKYDSILDVGCGDGEVLNYLNKYNKKYAVGIDISSERIKHAMENYPDIFFREGDITNIPFGNDTFDLVMAIEVVEHLLPENLNNALREMIRVSNKYILLQVPFNEKITPEICPHCLEFIYPRGHLNSFTETKLKKLFLSHNLKILKIDYFYPALNNIILSHPLIKKYIFNNFIKRGGFISILAEKRQCLYGEKSADFQDECKICKHQQPHEKSPEYFIKCCEINSKDVRCIIVEQ